MSRAAKFYEKYNLETPEEKKAREEAELKAKKKEARKAKKAVKQRVAEEMGDFTGINKDWEGKLIKKMVDAKEAEKTSYEHLDAVISQYNLPTAKDYVAVDMGFLNKLVNDEKEKAEMEMTNKLEQLITDMENRIVNKLMGEKVKLAELEIKKLELQVELARIEAAKLMAPVEFELTPFMEGKVEEVPTLEGAVEEVEEQFEAPKKKRTGKVIIPPTENPVPEEYITTRGVNWRAIKADGKFLDIMYQIVKHASEHGVNVSNGKEFKAFSNIANGAYQQYLMEYKGIKGAWKAFMMEVGLLA